jgi:hypothetical protein
LSLPPFIHYVEVRFRLFFFFWRARSNSALKEGGKVGESTREVRFVVDEVNEIMRNHFDVSGSETTTDCTQGFLNPISSFIDTILFVYITRRR